MVFALARRAPDGGARLFLKPSDEVSNDGWPEIISAWRICILRPRSPPHPRPTMTLPALFVRLGLPIALVCALAGCIGPFPLGYRTGSEKEEPVTLATRSATSQNEAQALLGQTITQTANLLITPEGKRNGYPVGYNYRYFLKTGNAKPVRLRFLDASDEANSIRAAFPFDGTDHWVAIQHSDYDYRKETVTGLPHSFSVGSFSVIVFSSEKILRRFKIEAVEAAPRFSFVPGSSFLRFWRNDGWWLLDVMSGNTQPEPNRIEETAPNNRVVTIPGTTLRITFELPDFTNFEESIRAESYVFKSETGSDPRQQFGKGGLGMMLLYGWHWQRDVRTRDRLLPSPPPADLIRTAQYYRFEKSIKEVPQYSLPARKEIIYLSDLAGWPLQITLYLPAPFERWAETVARFEATLRIEDTAAPK
jgi:hypothetical protein